MFCSHRPRHLHQHEDACGSVLPCLCVKDWFVDANDCVADAPLCSQERCSTAPWLQLRHCVHSSGGSSSPVPTTACVLFRLIVVAHYTRFEIGHIDMMHSTKIAIVQTGHSLFRCLCEGIGRVYHSHERMLLLRIQASALYEHCRLPLQFHALASDSRIVAEEEDSDPEVEPDPVF